MAVDLTGLSDDAVLASLADRDAVHDNRSSVGDLISNLASDRRFVMRRAELGALAEAVSSGGGREAVWRGIRLGDAFRPETTIRLPPRKRRWVSSLVGALAAIGVFLPVWWTWLSFREATGAYQQVLAAGAAEGESFLQLWATGFYGRLAPHQWLPNVALWSTVLIASCVVLIVAERLLGRSSDKADELEYAHCAAHLAQVLNLAQITINSRSVEDPVQGMDVIREAADQLLAAHQQTREAAEVMGQAASELEDSSRRATTEFRASAEAVLATVQRGSDGLIAALSEAMEASSTTLLDSVGDVAEALEHSAAGISGTLEVSVASAVGALDASAHRVARTSTDMRQALRDSADAHRVLAEAASGLAANAEAMQSGFPQQVQDAATLIGQEVARLRAEVSHLSLSAGGVGTSLGQHASALQHQITELTQIRAALERASGLDVSARVPDRLGGG